MQVCADSVQVFAEIGRFCAEIGQVFLLTSCDAIDLIKECQKEKIKILGIDSFMLTETTTQPLSEDSIDYSIIQSENYGNWDVAIAFIVQRKEKNYHFEIIFL